MGLIFTKLLSKSDFKSQSIFYIGSTFIYQLTNFINLYVLNAYLQDTFFAKFILIQNLASVFGMIVLMGMNPNSISILLKNNPVNKIYSSYFITIILNSLVLYISCLIFIKTLRFSFDFSFFICLFYLIVSIENSLSYLAIAELKTSLIMVVSIFRFVMLPALIFTAIEPASLQGVLLSYCLAGLGSSLIYFIGLQVRINKSVDFKFFYTRTTLEINLPFFISNISVVLSEYVLNKMLFSFEGGAQYIRVNTILKQLTNLLLFVPNKTLFLMVPKMLKANESADKSERMLYVNITIYIVLVVLFLLFRNSIYGYYHFPNSAGINLLAILFFLWGLLSIGNQYLGNRLIISGKHLIRNAADIILAITNVLVFWILIHSFPKFAYVIASIVSFLIINLFLIYRVRKI